MTRMNVCVCIRSQMCLTTGRHKYKTHFAACVSLSFSHSASFSFPARSFAFRSQSTRFFARFLLVSFPNVRVSYINHSTRKCKAAIIKNEYYALFDGIVRLAFLISQRGLQKTLITSLRQHRSGPMSIRADGAEWQLARAHPGSPQPSLVPGCIVARKAAPRMRR